MKLELIQESYITINDKILLDAIRNNGFASIDEISYYKILSYDDKFIYLELENNHTKKVEYSEIKIIKHNLHITVYKTEYNYLGSNNKIYDISKILNTYIICKENTSPNGVKMQITKGEKYFVTSCTLSGIDNRVKIGLTSDDDVIRTLDYAYYFKTTNDIRDDIIDKIMNNK